MGKSKSAAKNFAFRVKHGYPVLMGRPTLELIKTAREAGYVVINVSSFMRDICDNKLRQKVRQCDPCDFSWLDEVRSQMIRAALHRKILGLGGRVLLIQGVNPVGRMLFYWMTRNMTPEQVEALPADFEARITTRRFADRTGSKNKPVQAVSKTPSVSLAKPATKPKSETTQAARKATATKHAAKPKGEASVKLSTGLSRVKTRKTLES